MLTRSRGAERDLYSLAQFERSEVRLMLMLMLMLVMMMMLMLMLMLMLTRYASERAII